jgi:hypothetical protein
LIDVPVILVGTWSTHHYLFEFFHVFPYSLGRTDWVNGTVIESYKNVRCQKKVLYICLFYKMYVNPVYAL